MQKICIWQEACPDFAILCHDLNGGDLIVRYTEDAVYMTGEAVLVFSGEIEV